MPRRAPGCAGPGEERVPALSTMQDLAAVAARPELSLAETLTRPPGSPLDAAIGRATGNLLRRQQADGHWVFELEADATIPAEYVLLSHYLRPPDPELEARIARYLRRTQGEPWRLAAVPWRRLRHQRSVKAYFALKLLGDAADAPHMARARAAILAHGGGASAAMSSPASPLALFGEVPWRAVPVMPVEIMLLPRWFPFHLTRSRTGRAPCWCRCWC